MIGNCAVGELAFGGGVKNFLDSKIWGLVRLSGNTSLALTRCFVELSDVESVFDDVCGHFQSVDLLHGGLQAEGGCAVLRICQDGARGVAQPGHVQFSSWDHDAGSAGCDTGSDTGLVVPLGNRYEGHAGGEGVEHGAEAGVAPDRGGACEG